MPSTPSKASTGSTERGGCDPAERCECGGLLARRTARGIEIKCRRCKRIMLIPFDDVVEKTR